MCLMPPGAPRGAPPHKRGLRRACCTAVGDVLANNSPIFSNDLAVCVTRLDVFTHVRAHECAHAASAVAALVHGQGKQG